MNNSEYIEELIYKTIKYPTGKKDEEIKKLYNEVQKVFNSDEYTKEEKELLDSRAHLESLAMLYNGIF